MKEPTQKTWIELEKLAHRVKDDLRRKGIVVPYRESDGTITVDRFRIVKESTGLYSVTDMKYTPVIQNINLPETAALLANELALGKWVNDDILIQDRNFGYCLFEETITKLHANRSLKKNDIDRAELLLTKGTIAREKSKRIKQGIQARFEKLRRLR